MFRLYYFLQIPEKNTKSQIWEKWFMVIHIFEARNFCKNNHIFFHLTQIMFRALSEHFQNIHIQNIKQWWTDNTLEKFILIIHSSPKVSIEAHYEYYHIFVVVTNDAIHNISLLHFTTEWTYPNFCSQKWGEQKLRDLGRRPLCLPCRLCVLIIYTVYYKIYIQLHY